MGTVKMRTAEMNEHQNSYYILMAGLLGLTVGILMARPKHIPDAIVALLAGLFSCFVIAPAIAEICTNLAASFSYLAWLRATPDTALYVGIVGVCGIMGFQIVTGLRDDFLGWLRKWATKKLHDDSH